MCDLTIKPRHFFTALISLLLGFFIAFLFNTTSTTDHSSQLEQVDAKLQSLEQKISNIDDTLGLLLEQNKINNLTIKSDSPDEENIISANLKDILKELIHKELNENSQNDITSNEDTTAAWELISQVQGTAIAFDFFRSKEINELPAKQKELVVSEIIGMMNRGEINSNRFFGIE